MTGGPEEELDVEAALLKRAQIAIDAAAQLQAEAEVLFETLAALREDRLLKRCAWCSRYCIHERWMLVDKLPPIARSIDVTHTICEQCVEMLRQTGMSV